MSNGALYAGSFDPVTEGHLDIIERAATLFGRLVVAVGDNPNKRYWFDLEQRLELLRSSIPKDLPVQVVRFDGLLVDACKLHDTSMIVRGIRSAADFDLEARYGLANRDLAGVETVLLLAAPATQFVSSSLVKEIFVNGGDVSRYVSAPVLEALRKRGS